jgi:hypothetical protein
MSEATADKLAWTKYPDVAAHTGRLWRCEVYTQIMRIQRQ